MILDDIRELKQDIDELQMKIDSFGTVGAIRYDKECVQTSPSGDSLEKSVIRLIEDSPIYMLTSEWCKINCDRCIEWNQIFIHKHLEVT